MHVHISANDTTAKPGGWLRLGEQLVTLFLLLSLKSKVNRGVLALREREGERATVLTLTHWLDVSFSLVYFPNFLLLLLIPSLSLRAWPSMPSSLCIAFPFMQVICLCDLFWAMFGCWTFFLRGLNWRPPQSVEVYVRQAIICGMNHNIDCDRVSLFLPKSVSLISVTLSSLIMRTMSTQCAESMWVFAGLISPNFESVSRCTWPLKYFFLSTSSNWGRLFTGAISLSLASFFPSSFFISHLR